MTNFFCIFAKIKIFNFMIDKNIDQDILSYIAPDGKLIAQRCIRSVMQKHNWYDYLLQRYTDNTSESGTKDEWREIIYRLFNSIDEPPKCKTCGKTIKFNDGSYAKFCSKHCANIDPEVLEKNRTGVSVGMKKVYSERKDEIQAKRAKTLEERYGETTKSGSPYELKNIREQIKNTFKQKYGVENVFQLREFSKKG